MFVRDCATSLTKDLAKHLHVPSCFETFTNIGTQGVQSPAWG